MSNQKPLKRIHVLASEGVWSPRGVGGSDSFMRRMLSGFQQANYETRTIFATNKGVTNTLKYFNTLVKIRKSNDLILVYRLIPIYRLITAIALFGYGRSAVFLPFAPERKIWLTLWSYFIVSSKRIVVSENLRTLTKRITGIETKVIEPPVPKSFLNSPLVSKSSDKVIFVGRVDHRKGFDLVLELFEKLQKAGFREIELYVIYDLSDAGVLELLDRADNLQIIVNKVNKDCYTSDLDSELMGWLDQATYFVQPYRAISSTVDAPLLLYEALSRGLTILTTDLPQTSFVPELGRFSIEDFVEQSFRIITAGQTIKSKSLRLFNEKDTAINFLREFNEVD